MPLSQVDDPVFSERMMGDGIAIDPLGGLLAAPAAGEIIAVAPTGHSITLRLDNGAEVLIHIGLETVALGGRAFDVRAELGSRVNAGDPLIAFDPEMVLRKARSLVTPILVLSPGYQVEPVAVDRSVAVGDPLFKLHRVEGAADGAAVEGPGFETELAVPLAHGIHARPAARIAFLLKQFDADVRVEAHGREANARSTVGLLTLGVKSGDRIRLIGRGGEAEAAVTAVQALIASGMGEADTGDEPPAQAAPAASVGTTLRGICAAPGLVAGPVTHLRAADLKVPTDGAGPDNERRVLREAADALRAELDADAARGPSGVAFAHRAILDDPELAAAASRHIEAGRSAPFAWRAATRDLADRIRSTGDAFLIERIDDLIDVERRVIAKILGCPAFEPGSVADGSVVIAETLLPSEFLALTGRNIGAIATAGGGPTSHVAILAGSAGVPMLVAVGEELLAVPEGTLVVLDAGAGTLETDPSPKLLEKTRRAAESQASARADQRRAAQIDCVMADGTRIEVFANLGSLEDASRAVELGAEGCGLLRTEFLFLDRATAPTEDEQRGAYSAIASALGKRPLIVRTLDIGGDKPLSYLDLAQEDNPALGLRGVRFSLARPDLLATQLRAILTAVPASQCRIMVPMIVDVDELRAVRGMLDEAAAATSIAERIPLGVMIETPSAAILADSIASEADFLSVGTNDLSQYALAVDRGNPAVAGMVDAFHPAVLRLIAQAAKGAADRGRWIGVCGGLASEPKAAAILIGLGVTELSAVPAAVPAIKAVVRELTMERCRRIAAEALKLGTAVEVRALLAGEG